MHPWPKPVGSHQRLEEAPESFHFLLYAHSTISTFLTSMYEITFFPPKGLDVVMLAFLQQISLHFSYNQKQQLSGVNLNVQIPEVRSFFLLLIFSFS